MLVGDRTLGCSLISERRQPFPLESRVRGDHGPLCDHPQRRGRRRRIYLALMDDKYPSTDDHQSVRLDYSYPDAALELNQWLPLVKWLMAIPH